MDLLNCPEFIYAYFAAAKLGLIFVPLNFRMVGPEIEYQIKNCDARMLVFHDRFLENIQPIRGNIPIEPDKFVFVRSLAPNAVDCPQWALPHDRAVAEGSVEEPVFDEPVDLDDPLAILYTSGTTGRPKGVLVSHHQTYYKILQNTIYYDLSSNDRLLAHLPLFHSAGLFIFFTPVFCHGGQLIFRQQLNPARFVEDIETYGATMVTGPGTVWRTILSKRLLDGVDVSGVRCAIGGGDRIGEDMLLDYLESKGLYQQTGYGQTENSNMTQLPRGAARRKKGSVGLPGFFNDLWIQEEHTGRKLPPDEIGEIVCRSPVMMSGYWNNPKETAKVMVDGVLHTGDIGYLDEEGYLYFSDRAKDMYKSGGENVYSMEVENLIAKHPKVSDLAVVGVPDEKWGETGVAFVVPKKGETVTKEDIHEFLQGKLAKYKFPSRLEKVDSIPRNAMQKIMKVELKRMILEKDLP